MRELSLRPGVLRPYKEAVTLLDFTKTLSDAVGLFRVLWLRHQVQHPSLYPDELPSRSEWWRLFVQFAEGELQKRDSAARGAA